MHQAFCQFLKVFALIGVLFFAPVVFSESLFAQDAPSTDIAPSLNFEAWEKVADRAQSALEENKVSEKALSELREEIVGWRTVFQSAQDVNETRIRTVRAQIAALGAAPAEGQTEPEEIATLRASLNQDLGRLTEPQLVARDAFIQADGLVREIDRTVRQRRADALFTFYPTPLNPRLWLEALGDARTTFHMAGQEFGTSLRSRTKQSIFRSNLPAILLLTVAGIVLLVRGRVGFQGLSDRMYAKSDIAYRRVLGFLLSTGQALAPFAGVLSLITAISMSGMLGFRGNIIAGVLPQALLYWFAARWLTHQLFPVRTEAAYAISVSKRQAQKLRTSYMALAGLLVIFVCVQALAEFDNLTPAVRGVFYFPFVLIGGLYLNRIGRILRNTRHENSAEDSSETQFKYRFVGFVGRVLVVVGLACPVAAALGLQTASVAVVFRAVLTLWFVGLLAPVFAVVRDLYIMVTGADEAKARDALTPVLVSTLVVLLLIPIFALIWGARVADLTEVWSKLSEGVQIGESRISLNQFLWLVGVFGIGYFATRLVQSTLKGTVLPKTGIDPGGQVAIVSGLGYVGIFLAALAAISTAGINLSSLAIVAGALSVGIGFGLQTIVSNFVSGIILLIERPISEGDWIEVGPNMGTVRDISVRSTRIETFDRTDVIIPNSDLVSGTVTNFTRGNLVGRAIVRVGVAYGTDTRKVQKILEEIAEAQPLVSMNPPPVATFVGFGADSLDFEIRAILRDVNFRLATVSEINHQIAERFAEEGIEIPFAQRDIWLRNPEALHPGKDTPDS